MGDTNKGDSGKRLKLAYDFISSIDGTGRNFFQLVNTLNNRLTLSHEEAPRTVIDFCSVAIEYFIKLGIVFRGINGIV